MPSSTPADPPNFNRSALKTAVIYALVAGCWIALSDWVLAALVRDHTLFTELATYKGWAFVVVTAALLYALARRELRRAERDATARAKTEVERQRLQAAFEHCAHGIAIQDPATNRVLACTRRLPTWLVSAPRN